MQLKNWLLVGVLGIGLTGMGVSYYQGTRFNQRSIPRHAMMGRQSTSQPAAASPTIKTPARPLALPPLLKPTQQTQRRVAYTVIARTGTMAFRAGQTTKTLGYNGNYLGPVLQVNRGQTLAITTKNTLTQATSFHWHGAILPGNADGGPHETVAAGATKKVAFKVQQPAATLWFHPHAMGSTAKQVYQGLAGLIYVRDRASQRLHLPQTYGVNDFPVIIQDRQFTKQHQLDYEQAYQADGTRGSTLLVNGTLNPYLKVTTKLVRLRLVNGSNARNYQLTLSNHQAMQQIADDGGLLSRPVAVQRLQLSPGERAEVVIDTAKLSQPVTVMNGRQAVLQLRPTTAKRQLGRLPTKLVTLPAATMPKQAQKRTLTFSGMGRMVTINRQKFDPDRIDLTAQRGQPQVWTLKNSSGMMGGMSHPFHLHGVQFRILSVNGARPAANERGWKDTVALPPGGVVKITFKFKDRGIYMYHCHNLEHEEQGMMGQIKVS
ncbi:multicopper oxidase family protein [Lactiplantibacillus dongliensis]|uniref:Multicopper oxidase family protein n=1 Tax=Lactiplantibacillus dongliensis TaxID=2559919 RepID=A0ABW1R6Q3_9LACO|nr:multicopper oxidase domain-containing protein [Lactiplantibacillus dongliensis]